MKKLALKAGSLASNAYAVVVPMRTQDDTVKPGSIVKVTGNFEVSSVADNVEQCIGVVNGNWDLNKECVPIVLTGLVYMPASAVAAVGAAPINGGVIFTLGTEAGTIIKTDGSEETSIALVWVNV